MTINNVGQYIAMIYYLNEKLIKSQENMPIRVDVFLHDHHFNLIAEADNRET
jgi:hypothetical protein